MSLMVYSRRVFIVEWGIVRRGGAATTREGSGYLSSRASTKPSDRSDKRTQESSLSLKSNRTSRSSTDTKLREEGGYRTNDTILETAVSDRHSM